MRRSIEIDYELLQRASRATGLKTKKSVVNEGLRVLLDLQAQKRIVEALRGLANWEGDLEEMRRDRELPAW